MTAEEEDRNAGVKRQPDGSVVMGFVDARDHHLIRQNYRRMVGLDK